MKRYLVPLACVLYFAIALHGGEMVLSSPDFKDMQALPDKTTCYGDGVSPALSWSAAPKETKSFVLILDDPDAVGGVVWDHWIVYDIPATVHEIAEGRLPKEAKLGKSTNGKHTYVAPCPPKGSGVHGYRFRLYALDIKSVPSKVDTKEALLQLIKPHILAEATLIGKYEKRKKFLFF